MRKLDYSSFNSLTYFSSPPFPHSNTVNYLNIELNQLRTGTTRWAEWGAEIRAVGYNYSEGGEWERDGQTDRQTEI